jgi:hypothetical protein
VCDKTSNLVSDIGMGCRKVDYVVVDQYSHTSILCVAEHAAATVCLLSCNAALCLIMGSFTWYCQ